MYNSQALNKIISKLFIDLIINILKYKGVKLRL